MKVFSIIAAILITATSMATTPDQARELYEKRGEDITNAKAAADIYKSLASDGTRNKFFRAEMYRKQAQALYFFGNQQTSKDKKKEIHEKGYLVADEAIKILSKEGTAFGSTPVEADKKTDLALAHYFSAINMGKWAEARGVLASLGQWDEMKAHLDAVVKNDKTVENWGAHRTFGRAYLKLPFTHGGSSRKSMRYLQEAFEETFNDTFETSTNTTTTAYLLDTLAKRDETDQFCEVFFPFMDLTEASDEDLQELNPKLVPEAKKDLRDFLDGEGYEEDVLEYADVNC